MIGSRVESIDEGLKKLLDSIFLFKKNGGYVIYSKFDIIRR